MTSQYNLLTLCRLESCPILNHPGTTEQQRIAMYNQCLQGNHQCKGKDISRLIELHRMLIEGAMA